MSRSPDRDTGRTEGLPRTGTGQLPIQVVWPLFWRPPVGDVVWSGDQATTVGLAGRPGHNSEAVLGGLALIRASYVAVYTT